MQARISKPRRQPARGPRRPPGAGTRVGKAGLPQATIDISCTCAPVRSTAAPCALTCTPAAPRTPVKPTSAFHGSGLAGGALLQRRGTCRAGAHRGGHPAGRPGRPRPRRGLRRGRQVLRRAGARGADRPDRRDQRLEPAQRHHEAASGRADGTRRELSRAHCPGEHPATTRKRVELPGFGASGPGRARKLSTFPALAFSLAVDGVSFAGTGTLGSWSFSPRSRCGPGPRRATRVRHGAPVPCRTGQAAVNLNQPGIYLH